jgi:hypothetical protein
MNVIPSFEVLGTIYHANDSKTNCIQGKELLLLLVSQNMYQV